MPSVVGMGAAMELASGYTAGLESLLSPRLESQRKGKKQ